MIRKPLILLASAALLLLIVAIPIRLLLHSRSAPNEQLEIEFVIDQQPFVAKRVNLPDGSFVVEILDGDTGASLIRSSMSASPWMRWAIEEDQGNVRFYSSDVGTSLLVRSVGIWHEYQWIPGGDIASDYPMPSSVFDQLSERTQDKLRPWSHAAHQSNGN
jgi:hypothetical protein